jgi:anti-sigma factor RsiW
LVKIMTRDELEFSISQYLDGGLGARERDELETRLATDGEARAMFAEYESLQKTLTAAPLPDVRWDALAEHVSAQVARQPMPAQSHRIARWFSPARLAIAASVLIAAGIGFSILRSGPTSDSTRAKPISIVVNDEAPTANPISVSAATPTIEIAIGPSPSTDGGEPVVLRYADTVVQRPSKALIVSAAPAVQDSLLAPF